MAHYQGLKNEAPKPKKQKALRHEYESHCSESRWYNEFYLTYLESSEWWKDSISLWAALRGDTTNEGIVTRHATE